MADTKITSLLTPQVTTNPATDVLPIVNIADTSMATSGSTRKITVNQLLGAGGTATLASATITGDLTVRTNRLATTTTGVGIGTASPIVPLDVRGGAGAGALFLRTTDPTAAVSSAYIQTPVSTGFSALVPIYGFWYQNCGMGNPASDAVTLITASTERYRIDSAGTNTWSNVGGAGTAMTLNSTGLGVGASPQAKLHVSNGATIDSGLFTGLMIGASVAGSARSASIIKDTSTPYNLIIRTQDFTGGTTGSFIVRNGSTDQFQIDSSGNVGIGVTPSAWGAGYKTIANLLYADYYSNNGGLIGISGNAYNNGTSWIYKNTTAAHRYEQSIGSGHIWFNAPSGTAGNAITWTQAMTLDASGNLLVGTTASGGQNGFCVLRPLSGGVVATTTETAHNFGALTGTSYATFLYATTAIGSITQNGTTGVLYNITSDYRLKESVQPLVGGLARVNALKPSVYKWKSDGSNGEGFLAHELAEVVPFAVSGEKDAVNEDGSIKSQGIDMSRVVPILVAAIQELTARVQTLEAK